MPQAIHTITVHGGMPSGQSDRLRKAVAAGVANAAGGGAGQSVTTAFAFTETMPTPYAVSVTPSQDATAWVTSKTASGFNVVLAPRLAASTLSVGTFDVLVEG